MRIKPEKKTAVMLGAIYVKESVTFVNNIANGLDRVKEVLPLIDRTLRNNSST